MTCRLIRISALNHQEGKTDKSSLLLSALLGKLARTRGGGDRDDDCRGAVVGGTRGVTAIHSARLTVTRRCEEAIVLPREDTAVPPLLSHSQARRRVLRPTTVDRQRDAPRQHPLRRAVRRGAVRARARGLSARSSPTSLDALP